MLGVMARCEGLVAQPGFTKPKCEVSCASFSGNDIKDTNVNKVWIERDGAVRWQGAGAQSDFTEPKRV